jgi:phage/plasmid-associated DNA primase
LFGGFLSKAVLDKVREIDRKLDELREFLEDVFVTPEEHALLKEADNLVKSKSFNELTPIDEVEVLLS